MVYLKLYKNTKTCSIFINNIYICSAPIVFECTQLYIFNRKCYILEPLYTFSSITHLYRTYDSDKNKGYTNFTFNKKVLFINNL